MEIPMRPRKVRQILGSIFFGALIGGGLMWLGMARAHAEPPLTPYEAQWVQTYGPSVVCGTLDEDPEQSTIEGTMMFLIENQRMPAQQAGNIVVASVERYCMKYLPILQDYATGGKMHYAIV